MDADRDDFIHTDEFRRAVRACVRILTARGVPEAASEAEVCVYLVGLRPNLPNDKVGSWAVRAADRAIERHRLDTGWSRRRDEDDSRTWDRVVGAMPSQYDAADGRDCPAKQCEIAELTSWFWTTMRRRIAATPGGAALVWVVTAKQEGCSGVKSLMEWSGEDEEIARAAYHRWRRVYDGVIADMREMEDF